MISSPGQSQRGWLKQKESHPHGRHTLISSPGQSQRGWLKQKQVGARCSSLVRACTFPIIHILCIYIISSPGHSQRGWLEQKQVGARCSSLVRACTFPIIHILCIYMISIPGQSQRGWLKQKESHPHRRHTLIDTSNDTREGDASTTELIAPSHALTK